METNALTAPKNSSLNTSSNILNSSQKPQRIFRFGSFEPDISSDSSSEYIPNSSFFQNSIGAAVTLAKSPFTAFFGLAAAVLYYIYSNTLSLLNIEARDSSKHKPKDKPTKSPSPFNLFEMEKLDLAVIATIIVGATTFLFRKFIFGNHILRTNSIPTINIQAAPKIAQHSYDPQRDLSFKMFQNNQNVVLIYGSQTGTAEDLAKRFARELHLDFNAQVLIVDPELYDLESLSKISPDHIAVFLVSTTGEGEPTDNMAKWYEALIGEDIFTADFSDLELPSFVDPTEESDFSGDYEFDTELPLANLNFSIFGLGNSTYEHFNLPTKQLTKRLRSLGAKLVGPVGLGDDDVNIDDDFEKWTGAAAPLIAKFVSSSSTGIDSSPNKYEPSFIVKELDILPIDASIGSVRPEILENASSINISHVDSKHPWYCLPLNSKVLTHTSSERRIIHLELDLDNINLPYTTGDHVALFPTNYETQVRLLLNVLNLDGSKPISLSFSPNASDNKPFPHSISSYSSMLRHYLDITLPVPKDSIKHVLLPYARSEPAKAFLKKLIDDKDYYKNIILTPVMSPGELIQNIHTIEKKEAVSDDLKFNFTFSALIDLLPRISPRYYSISSSNLESPNKISITAVVLNYKTPNNINRYGIATNYINAIHDTLSNPDTNSDIIFTSDKLSYCLKDTRKHSSNNFAIPIYIRKSTFRLPSDPSVPIVMVGPGTGIAPFRGFIRERFYQAKNSIPVGPTVLFFGNRNESKDFLYKDELLESFAALSSSNKNSKVITAFSRDQKEKIYVQDRMTEHSALIWDLINNQNGHFYICGDGKTMSKDVIATLKRIAQNEGKLDETRASSWFTTLKNTNRYAEDVWA
ncbi:hypothetical protein BB561_004557 [Smittium simulii]|uniref:NADPH--hemoprotein reductase n=1 Tax=Smittium simulii TaxID=133385 RepID=A0A2T9YFJ0_9FUNG|nr:hypothetical protein BB561_004557 [Smittium simulii]